MNLPVLGVLWKKQKELDAWARGMIDTKLRNPGYSAAESGTALLTRVLGVPSRTPSVKTSDQALPTPVPVGTVQTQLLVPVQQMESTAYRSPSVVLLVAPCRPHSTKQRALAHPAPLSSPPWYVTSVLSGVSWATLDVTSQLTALLFLTETGQPAPYSAFTCCSHCEVTSLLGCSKAQRLAETRALNPPAWCPVLPRPHASRDLGKSHPLSKLHLYPPWTQWNDGQSHGKVSKMAGFAPALLSYHFSPFLSHLQVNCTNDKKQFFRHPYFWSQYSVQPSQELRSLPKLKPLWSALPLGSRSASRVAQRRSCLSVLLSVVVTSKIPTFLILNKGD